MKRIFTTFFIAGSTILFGQNYHARFWEAMKEEDVDLSKEILVQWESDSADDADLAAAWFNFLIQSAEQEVIVMNDVPTTTEYLEITDSTGKVVSYMESTRVYDDSLLQAAFDKLEKGIKAHPDRLDLHFGKIHMLGVFERYDDFTAEVLRVIQLNRTFKNRWKWTKEEALTDAEVVFLNAIQDYQSELYYTDNDSLFVNIRQIGEAVLKDYPKNVEQLNFIAITYLLSRDYDQSLTYLERAYEVNPTDVIILSNFVELYRRMGNVEGQLKYLKLIEPLVSGEEQAAIQNQIEVLENQ